MTHNFVIRNEGDAVLTIDRMEFSLPGMTSRFKPKVEPGAEGNIQIEWNTENAMGGMEAEANVYLDDPVQPKVTLHLSAVVNPLIELLPMPAVYFSIFKGEKAEESVRIVNHESAALQIFKLEPEGDHFRPNLKTIEAGKIYELVVTIPESVLPGCYQESVTLHTNHPKLSAINVPVNVFVKSDLYANPENLDFTGIDISLLAQRPELIDYLKQTVMVKKRQGDFEIKSIQCDIPFLTIIQSPPAGKSSSFRLDVEVRKEKLVRGKTSGKIHIFTDDPKFPEVVIPVQAEVF